MRVCTKGTGNTLEEQSVFEPFSSNSPLQHLPDDKATTIACRSPLSSGRCCLCYACRSCLCCMNFSLPRGARQGRSASGLAEAPAALMGPSLVVVAEPGIEVGRQLLGRPDRSSCERRPGRTRPAGRDGNARRCRYPVCDSWCLLVRCSLWRAALW
jgi:hypothetical protein